MCVGGGIKKQEACCYVLWGKKRHHRPLGAKQTELRGEAIEALSAQLAPLHPSRSETNLTNARLPAETTTTQAQRARTEAIIKKHTHDDEEVLGDRGRGGGGGGR